MKVLVVGASRGSGNQVVRALAADGHDVTAFARTASEVDYGDADVRRVDGDVLSPADIEKAVIGQDAVVVTLGISDNPLKVQLLRRAGTALRVRSAGTREVVAAMRRQGVDRLVVQTTYGLGEGRAHLPASYKLMFGLLLRRQIEDTGRQEDEVRASGLAWTLVRPVSLHDHDTDAAPVVDANHTIAGLRVSRRQVARAIADAVGDRSTAGSTLSISAP